MFKIYRGETDLYGEYQETIYELEENVKLEDKKRKGGELWKKEK